MKITITSVWMSLALSACSNEAVDAPARFQTLADIQSSAQGGLENKKDKVGRPFGYQYLGQTLPEFSLPTTDGTTISSEDLRGKWSIIDVWGLWCSDCLVDAPYVQELRAALKKEADFQFVSILVPPNDTRLDEIYGKWPSVDAYFTDKGYESYPVAMDYNAVTKAALGIKWTPTYLLVAPDLRVAAFRSDLSVTKKGGTDETLKQIQKIKANYAPS